MVRLRIVRRYTLPTLKVRRGELLELAADGVEEVLSEIEILDILLKLGDEEGELDYYEEEIVAYDPAYHRRIFTPNILRILSELSLGVESVSELARRVGRNVSNVWRDLKFLEKLDFVALLRSGNRVKPMLLAVEVGVVLE